MPHLQVAGFLDHSLVNGEGFRSTLFLSGCHHNCKGCHNPAMQDTTYGESVALDTVLQRILKNLPLVDGVTISGGDPFEQAPALLELLKRLKAKGISVWVYTGYLYETLALEPIKSKLLPYIDVLVDGPYIKSQHTDTTKYIGSSNQRILSLTNGMIQKQK
ncbi:MAG: anaerobic ribonucleoside-triphosphate reductase activating protein [Cellulosilyticaceae bacterium]